MTDDQQKQPPRLYSRPADRSLEAYKQWMRGVPRELGVPDDLTDADLERSWHEFWAKADSKAVEEQTIESPTTRQSEEKFTATMFVALESYMNGIPIILLDQQQKVLHGGDTLEQIAEYGLTLACLKLSGVDGTQFQESDWPKILEIARQDFWNRILG